MAERIQRVQIFMQSTLPLLQIQPTDILDIAILAFIIYKLLWMLRKTSSGRVLRGVLLLLMAMFLSTSLSLTATSWLLDKVVQWGFVVLVVLFQPEIRRFLERRGVENIAAHESRLIRRMGEGLREIPGIRPFLSPDPSLQAGVLSFRAAGRDCEEVGNLLGSRGIALRAGLHCAPLAHETAGTLETGTLRASVSAFNTDREIGKFLQAVQNLTAQKQ